VRDGTPITTIVFGELPDCFRALCRHDIPPVRLSQFNTQFYELIWKDQFPRDIEREITAAAMALDGLVFLRDSLPPHHKKPAGLDEAIETVETTLAHALTRRYLLNAGFGKSLYRRLETFQGWEASRRR
jgi:hypothetical protein